MKDTVKYGLIATAIFIAAFTLLTGVAGLTHHESFSGTVLYLYTRTFPLAVLVIASAIAFRVGYRERKKYNESVLSRRTSIDESTYAQLRRNYLRKDFGIRMIQHWGVVVMVSIPTLMFDQDDTTVYLIQVVATSVIIGGVLGLIMRQLKKT